MNSEIKLIGLSGQLQNGKDTVANLILQQSENKWKTKKFANIIKKMVALIIGCNIDDLENDNFKNRQLGEEWRRWYYCNHKLKNNDNPSGRISKYFSSEKEAIDNPIIYNATLESEILTPRLLLQLLGTEGGREIIHPNIWINATFNDYDDNDYFLITDVRFLNEVLSIKKRNGIIVRIIRPSIISTYGGHLSETSLNDYNEWDYKIINDGSLKDLDEKIKKMFKHFNIK